MRTLDQINEDIDYLLDEGRDYRADLETLEQMVKDSAADYRRAEHEHDAATLHELDSLSQDLREQRAAIRRNEAELELARQERWEYNVLRNLAAESEALFDAKLRHAAAYDAYGEAVREHKAHEYSDVGTYTTTRRAMEAAHSDLCEAALHLSNVQAVFDSTRESAAACTSRGRALRSSEHITRALAA